MKQKALRDHNGKPVFVNKYGEYMDKFPENNIVDRDIDKDGFTVYFFMDLGDNYAEFSYDIEEKEKALEFATNIYGNFVALTENIQGEIFEIEVHNN